MTHFSPYYSEQVNDELLKKKLDENIKPLVRLVSSLIEVGEMNQQQAWEVLLKVPTRLLEWFLLCADELNSDDMRGMSQHTMKTFGKEKGIISYLYDFILK